MLNDHIDELIRENKAAPFFADNGRASKSDELRSIGSFSVLSEPDRKTVNEARRWCRYMWQQGLGPKIDALEWDGLFELMKKLDDLWTRTAGEPQLVQRPDNARERAHASERESVCRSCGGRTINGTCVARCEQRCER